MEDFRVRVNSPENSAPRKKSRVSRLRPTKFKTWLGLILAVVIIGGGLGGYLYQTNRIENLKKENQRLSDPQQAAQQESARLKEEVSKLIELPNETPTIATVVDASKLKSQAFFANAQNGDRVLMFAEAKKAILYRPSTNKIIEVAPINIGSGAAAETKPATAPTTTQKR